MKPGSRHEVAGTYRGQCAELCGKDHGYMPVVVEVLEEGRLRILGGSERLNDNNGSSE